MIFGSAKVPELPFDSMQSNRPEDLWRYVEKARAACDDVLVIPHNANLSNGLLFQTKDSDGKPFTREYASRRADARWIVPTQSGPGAQLSLAHIAARATQGCDDS